MEEGQWEEEWVGDTHGEELLEALKEGDLVGVMVELPPVRVALDEWEGEVEREGEEEGLQSAVPDRDLEVHPEALVEGVGVGEREELGVEGRVGVIREDTLTVTLMHTVPPPLPLPLLLGVRVTAAFVAVGTSPVGDTLPVNATDKLCVNVVVPEVLTVGARRVTDPLGEEVGREESEEEGESVPPTTDPDLEGVEVVQVEGERVGGLESVTEGVADTDPVANTLEGEEEVEIAKGVKEAGFDMLVVGALPVGETLGELVEEGDALPPSLVALPLPVAPLTGGDWVKAVEALEVQVPFPLCE